MVHERAPLVNEITHALNVNANAIVAAQVGGGLSAPMSPPRDDAQRVQLILDAARAISGRDDWPLPEGPLMPISPERKVELLRKAAAILGDPHRAFSLRHCPPARPTADFSATVLETIEDARQRLGGLPSFVVHFRRGSATTPRAEASRPDDGALAVWLDIATPLAELRQTVAHECQHVVDLASGQQFTAAQLERRAADFADAFAST
jgi:hypothetical protein